MLKILIHSRHCVLKSQNENLTREGWQDSWLRQRRPFAFPPCENVDQNVRIVLFSRQLSTLFLQTYAEVWYWYVTFCVSHTRSIKCLVFSVSHKHFKAPLSSRGCKVLMFCLPRLCPHFQNCSVSFLR